MSTTFVRRGARPGSKPRPIHSQQPQRSAEQFVDDYAMDRIDFRVRELTQRFHLDDAEQEDYRQDMMMELLKARKRFDPARAARETFSGAWSNCRPKSRHSSGNWGDTTRN